MNEREWISHLRARAGMAAGGVEIGDDAAVLPGNLVVSTDAFVEEIHFRWIWASPRIVGAKMAQSALSDIAAMGGTPLWMLANFSSSDSSNAPELLEGLLTAGVPLIGGDTTAAPPGATTVSLTVIGRASRPVLRSGARPGDVVYVSGPLGGSRAGLTALEKKLTLPDLIARFLSPRARFDLSESWGAVARSMIDISDGLASELHHIARKSNVCIEIERSAIPIFPGIERAGLDPISTALESGEEFELLATSALPPPGGFPIGRVVAGSGVTIDGSPLPDSGFTHWAT
ncbi:MAG: thiamine-phosphate kinase [Candidatus Hydrogenedentota bacterium]